MGWRLSEEHDVEVVGIVRANLPQKAGEAGGLQAGQLPPEGRPRGRFHRGVQPGILVQGLDDLEWLHAIAWEPPVDGEGQAEPAFIRAEDPDGLFRGLASSGCQGAAAARALFAKGRGLGDGFFAWLGRGRFRLALSG